MTENNEFNNNEFNIKDPFHWALIVKKITKEINAGLWTPEYRRLALATLNLANCVIDCCLEDDD